MTWRAVICELRNRHNPYSDAWLFVDDRMGAICRHCGSPARRQSCHCWQRPCVCRAGTPMVVQALTSGEERP